MKKEFKNIKNFRSFAGIKTSNGNTIKENIILRSGHLAHATAEEIDILKNKYNLKLIIDLRSEQELCERADPVIEDVEYIRIPYFNESKLGITGGMGADVMTAVRNTKNKEELSSYIPDLTNIYPMMVSDPYSVEKIKEVIHLIMNNRNGSVLFHCTAGKDRTGITSAIILHILGVSEEDIMADYLETNRETMKQAKMYSALAKAFFMGKDIAQKTYDVFVADKKYLQLAHEKICSNYGSIDEFIHIALDVTDEEINEYKQYVLE